MSSDIRVPQAKLQPFRLERDEAGNRYAKTPLPARAEFHWPLISSEPAVFHLNGSVLRVKATNVTADYYGRYDMKRHSFIGRLGRQGHP